MPVVKLHQEQHRAVEPLRLDFLSSGQCKIHARRLVAAIRSCHSNEVSFVNETRVRAYVSTVN